MKVGRNDRYVLCAPNQGDYEAYRGWSMNLCVLVVNEFGSDHAVESRRNWRWSGLDR